MKPGLNQQPTTKPHLETLPSSLRSSKGLWVVCANCHKVRVDHGKPYQQSSWKTMGFDPAFTSRENISHGLCPECFRLLYPGMEIKSS